MALWDILIFAVNSVMPIILLVLLGYLLKRRGLFTKEFLKIGNKTVFRVLLPVLLFTNLAEMDSFLDLRIDAVLYVLGAVALLFGAGLLLSCAVPDRRQKGVLLQCVFRSNFALIGVALAQLIAGDKGVQAAALLSAFTIPVFNILGVVALSVFAPSGTQTTSPWPRIRKILRDILHNPLIRGVLAGILWVSLRPLLTRLPAMTVCMEKLSFVRTALDYLARASTPVALLVLGGQFELERVSGLKKQIALGVLGRLILAPLVGIGGAAVLQYMGILHFDNGIYAALVALFATPVAVASAIMAEEMDNDGQLAGQLVLWTTLFSAAVIFVTIVLLRSLRLL